MTSSLGFHLVSPPFTPELDPLVESEVWTDEEWNMFEFGATAQQSEAPKISKQDPLGFMDGKGVQRRLTHENIRQLCPKG